MEYCNGKGDSALANLRRKHGFVEPHGVKYWGVGNEVDGPWQIGYKTPQEYARALTEFGKVMKWTDPDIKLIASANCIWEPKKNDWVERGQLILEHAGNLVDYLALHWYVGNEANDFASFMAVSELFEERLSAYEGLIRAVCLDRGITRPIHITVDEWGIRPRAFSTVEDALVTAMNLNAFIRHANSVKMANLTMVTAPMRMSADGLVRQTVFYPFELYRQTCGRKALDVFWDGETFSTAGEGREFSGIRILDVAATFSESRRQLVVYVVNRSQEESIEATISLADGRFMGSVQASVINGEDIKTENTFEKPNEVGLRQTSLEASGASFAYSFEPHSVTALVCAV